MEPKQALPEELRKLWLQQVTTRRGKFVASSDEKTVEAASGNSVQGKGDIRRAIDMSLKCGFHQEYARLRCRIHDSTRYRFFLVQPCWEIFLDTREQDIHALA